MNYSTFNVIKRAVNEAKGFYPHIVLLFLLSLLSTPIALLKPLALKLLIDSGFGSHPIPGYIGMFFPGDFAFTFAAVSFIAACFVGELKWRSYMGI
jgi:ATP-binding cassette, subfamily B, bacterial